MSNGPQFWDQLCGPRDGSFPEYVSPNIWLGEYVSKLEQVDQPTSPKSNKGDSGASSGTQAASRVPRWKRRTPEQIEANKAAQKRFREKKKAKLNQQSAKVDELTEQMRTMDGVNTEVKALEEETEALEASLWAKEAELHRIRMELDEKTPQAVYDAKVQSSCIPSFLNKPPSLEGRIEKVASRWLKEKEGLERFLKDQGLDPSQAVKLKPSLVKEVEQRSLGVMAQCMEIMTLGGPQLDVLLRTFADREEDLMRQESMEKYVSLAASLNLSAGQVQWALDTRADILQRLERVYTERQVLNMNVMALLMAAPQSSTPPPKQPEQQGRSLKVALQELQSNLAEEQRLESEHHHVVFRKILTPLQGAWFIVKAYPSHCDTLAFVHGVAELHERQQTA